MSAGNVAFGLPDLSPDLEGFRITQISDLHVGPTIQKRYVRKVVKRVNDSKPDVVVFTGDLADAKASNIKIHLKPLGEIRAQHGMFYVTGNHEYYWGAKELINEMNTLGFTPLINENREVTIKSARVLVAGVTDPAGASFYPDHRPDLTRALKTTSAASDFALKLLLCHRPGVSLEAEPAGVDIQFSGHTHAGQFFPFNLLIPLAHRYYRGLNRHGRTLGLCESRNWILGPGQSLCDSIRNHKHRADAGPDGLVYFLKRRSIRTEFDVLLKRRPRFKRARTHRPTDLRCNEHVDRTELARNETV